MSDLGSNHMFFDVLLHFGTLIAICFMYWSDIKAMFTQTIDMLSGRTVDENGRRRRFPEARLFMLIIVATLPLVLILPVHKYIEALSNSTVYVGIALILTGCMLLVSDKMAKGSKTEKNMLFTDALIVGLCQCVATLPGLSRSGTTITAGIATGHDRSYAVKFSLLMSIPAVLGATLLELVDAFKAGIDVSLIPAYLFRNDRCHGFRRFVHRTSENDRAQDTLRRIFLLLLGSRRSDDNTFTYILIKAGKLNNGANRYEEKKSNSSGKNQSSQPAKKPNSTEPATNPARRIIAAACFLFAAVLVAIGIFAHDGVVVGWLCSLLKGLFGYGFWICAPVFLLAAYILAFNRERPCTWRMTATLFLPLLAGALVNLLLSQVVVDNLSGVGELFGTLYSGGKKMLCAGVLGTLIAFALEKAFSIYGAAIVLLLAFIFFALSALSITPKKAF